MKGHRSGGPDFPTQHSTWHLGEAVQGGRGQRGLPSGLDRWSVGDMFYPLWLQVFQHSLSPLPDVMAPVFPAAVSFPEGSQGGPCNHRSNHATLSFASLPLLPGTSGKEFKLRKVLLTPSAVPLMLSVPYPLAPWSLRYTAWGVPEWTMSCMLAYCYHSC